MTSMKLRKFKNKDDLHIELLSLNLRYIFENVIEGSLKGAYLVLGQEIARELASPKPPYICGFSEKDNNVDLRWKQENMWPPHEEVIVRCRSCWVPAGKDPHGKTFLTIKWYQDVGDPFEYLTTVLNKIDWKKYSHYEKFID